MGKSKYRITLKEFLLALVIALMGLLFSTKLWLKFLDSLNPILGFFVYYLILYSVMFGLGLLGLVAFGIKIKDPLQVLGLLMVAFAFFITTNWESSFVQYTTTGSFEGASNTFYASEDGATWYFFYNILGISNILISRILTFVITPFLFALGGLYLASGKIKLLDL
jgi:hypothetical protein